MTEFDASREFDVNLLYTFILYYTILNKNYTKTNQQNEKWKMRRLYLMRVVQAPHMRLEVWPMIISPVIKAHS